MSGTIAEQSLSSWCTHQAKMVSDPLFGDIQYPTPKKDIKGFKPSSFAKAKSTPTYHGSSFATVTTSEVSAKTQPLIKTSLLQLFLNPV